MPVNVEVKARVEDMDGLRTRVIPLATAGPCVLLQTDTFFVVPTGRLKLRDFANGPGELIYYERANTAGPRTSAYAIVPSADPEALRRILAGALGVWGTVRKRRELFMVGQTRVHLDDVEGLGGFLELEVVLRPDQTAREGEEIARELMTVLGVSSGDLVAQAYADLLRDRLEAIERSRLSS